MFLVVKDMWFGQDIQPSSAIWRKTHHSFGQKPGAEPLEEPTAHPAEHGALPGSTLKWSHSEAILRIFAPVPRASRGPRAIFFGQVDDRNGGRGQGMPL